MRELSRGRMAGFTLVEMLVVIGIIAVLAAIIMPAYTGAQERARQANCLSNLHQIALAVKVYRMDNKAYPQTLADLYPDYISSSKALICKDDSSGVAPLNGSNQLVYSSYLAKADGTQYWNWNGLDANGVNKAAPDPGWDARYKGMVNVNAPDSTIITHCVWHRPFYGSSTQMDPVIRIGGDANLVKIGSFDWTAQPE